MQSKMSRISKKDQVKFIHENRAAFVNVLNKVKDKHELLRVFPPQNEDNTIIWVWIDDYEKYINENESRKWRDLLKSENRNNKPFSGYFAIFKDDKFKLLWSLSSNTPQELFESEEWRKSNGLEDVNQY